MQCIQKKTTIALIIKKICKTNLKYANHIKAVGFYVAENLVKVEALDFKQGESFAICQIQEVVIAIIAKHINIKSNSKTTEKSITYHMQT